MASLLDTLWSNHPAIKEKQANPCSKGTTPNYEDQCVIRLGMALTRSGIELTSFKGAFCWYGHGKTHPLRVEEFKLWLNSNDATFLPNYAGVSKRTASGWQNSWHAYAGKRGIVAFLDFWGTANTGDHIDLWNGSRLALGADDYFRRSREIWFWTMQ